uniref:Uncharacterized protein n=1 Tax=Peronospora matthiolae TaxID=2874970 RepID=A0AAV1TL42_9STRA
METVKVEAIETSGEISVETKDNLEVGKVEHGDAFVVEPMAGVSQIIEKEEPAVDPVATIESSDDMASVAEMKVDAGASGEALETGV